MGNKIKINEMVSDLGRLNIISKTICEVAPRFTDVEDFEQLAKGMGLTRAQLQRIEKRVAERYAEELLISIDNVLRNEDSLEIPGSCNIAVRTSQVFTNPDGTFRKLLTVRTRSRLEKALNPSTTKFDKKVTL